MWRLLFFVLPLSAAAADLTLDMAGSLSFPDEAVSTEGETTTITGLSGLTRLADDSWVAAMDNSDLVVMFTLQVSKQGEPTAIADIETLKLEAKHDYEDISVCPPALTKRIARRFTARGRPDPGPCLLLCEEDTPAIRGVAIATGALVGMVPLPEPLLSPRPNRGLESLAVEPDGTCIYTANEEATASDGPAPRTGLGTIVRLCAIPVPGVAAAYATTRQYAYPVDPPHEFVAFGKQAPFSGLVALVAIGDGRLLALERSAGRGIPPLENRIYLVATSAAQDVSGIDRDLARHKEKFLAKRLLWRDSLGLNLEGLALGQALADGRRLLAAIADNGGLGTPTQIVTFRLRGLDGPAARR
ncbi:MAG: esterase-like activity of phytase family protein [Planctomycetia bacterium]